MEQIRVIGLSKSFGVRQVFNKVSFEIKHGERVGLVGPNGAGKSTLMKCLLGIEEYDEGQVVKDSATTIGYLQQDINLGDDSLAIEIQKPLPMCNIGNNNYRKYRRSLKRILMMKVCSNSSPAFRTV